MINVFNVNFEFDPLIFDEVVDRTVTSRNKGYVCVIDGNVLTIGQRDENYRKILNGATINTCDGSSIAALASKIHKKEYKTYNGPEIFKKYIERPLTHVIVGNTTENVRLLREKLKENGFFHKIHHIEVPFKKVEKFDYKGIGESINELSPDMIWISLGAPKQERFMSLLLPYLNSGLMFGIGAAINFYLDDSGRSNKNIGGFRFIWLGRLFKEPKKQFSRFFNYLKILPNLYFTEKKKYKNSISNETVG